MLMDVTPPPVGDEQIAMWEAYRDAALAHDRARTDPTVTTKVKVQMALASVLAWRRFSEACGCPLPVGPVTRPRQSYPYMVWTAGERRQTLPRNRYQTVDAAQAEAEEAARRTPGATVFVLEEIMRTQAND